MKIGAKVIRHGLHVRQVLSIGDQIAEEAGRDRKRESRRVVKSPGPISYWLCEPLSGAYPRHCISDSRVALVT